MKIKLKVLLLLLLVGSSFALADEYPKIDVSGFKKWEYKDAKVNPQSNYFLGLTHLGGYSPTTTGSPWQERLQLTILGQLTDKLSVAYDVEQQPETPDKYDVKVNYDNKHQLTFGDFSANFSGNEFASATKFLNGVMVTSKDNNYDFIAVPSAKLKSQIQGLTSQKGNNSKGPYSLGHGSIFEGSERIELNGLLLKDDQAAGLWRTKNSCRQEVFGWSENKDRCLHNSPDYNRRAEYRIVFLELLGLKI